MDIGNETALRHCRFLTDTCFEQLYATFIAAFADYVYPFALTAEQFKNHIILNAVDLNRTVGCIDNGELVGFSLNGFGEWNGKPTVYDAGTGVIPRCRRQGVSDAMFEMMLPVFKEQGYQQFLLEVITINRAAIRLYDKLGFEAVRELALLQCDKPIVISPEKVRDIEIKLTDEADWEKFTPFWAARPSWQNSMAAIDRSTDRKRVAEAYIDGRCVGYTVFSSVYGRIAQIAVDPAYSGRGVGTRLVQQVQAETAPGHAVQVINADKTLTDVRFFFRKLGFYERISQYEMIKEM